MPEEQQKPRILFGQLKLTIVGGLFKGTDILFTTDVTRAALLEQKLLKVLSEFVDEA